MSAHVLILNAGSSSLKFSVYQRPDNAAWRLAAKGQIEGIGTSPRLTAKSDTGEKLADQKPDKVRDSRDALETLAGWLRSQFGGARVIGVGHRVVHGGSRYTAPVVVTAELVQDLRRLVALAPLHQPHHPA